MLLLVSEHMSETRDVHNTLDRQCNQRCNAARNFWRVVEWSAVMNVKFEYFLVSEEAINLNVST